MVGRNKSYQRTHVLQSAMMLFWKNGYEECSMRDLAKVTGLTTGSLYHEFGGKEACFEAVLAYYIETIVQPRIDKILLSLGQTVEGPEKKKMAEGRKAALSALEHFLLSSFYPLPDPVAGQACLLLNTSIDHRINSEAIHQIVKYGVSGLKRGIMHCLQIAKQNGELRPDADLPTLTNQIVLFLSGLLAASRTTSDTAWLVDAVKQQIALMKPICTQQPNL